MLGEIIQEVRDGRAQWKHHTVQHSTCPDQPLTDTPHQSPLVAVAVGSDGKDKIRRGDDWRRSEHNSTCILRDQPYRRNPDYFVSLALATHRPGADLHVWGHDHDSADRQLELQNQNTATSCSSQPTDRHFRATVHFCSVQQPVYGHTLGSGTVCWPRPGSPCPPLHYGRLWLRFHRLRGLAWRPRIQHEAIQATTTSNGTAHPRTDHHL